MLKGAILCILLLLLLLLLLLSLSLSLSGTTQSLFICLNTSHYFHCSVNFAEPDTQYTGIYNVDYYK